MSDERHCTSVRFSEELNEAIEQQLGYEDTKGEWIAEACRQRLERERQRASPEN